jgi:hypothetical protein
MRREDKESVPMGLGARAEEEGGLSGARSRGSRYGVWELSDRVKYSRWAAPKSRWIED